jgi:hypothetical protein
MNVTHIQEYNGKSIVKSGGLYYLTDGSEKSLTELVGYSTIKDLVEADKKEAAAETESKPKARKKSK